MPGDHVSRVLTDWFSRDVPPTEGEGSGWISSCCPSQASCFLVERLRGEVWHVRSCLRT